MTAFGPGGNPIGTAQCALIPLILTADDLQEIIGNFLRIGGKRPVPPRVWGCVHGVKDKLYCSVCTQPQFQPNTPTTPRKARTRRERRELQRRLERMEAPPVPAGAKLFTYCQKEIRLIPLGSFKVGRETPRATHRRFRVFEVLASVANKDGTMRQYPNLATIAASAGLGRRQGATYLRQLAELGWVVNGHYTRERGERIRRLVIPAGVQL